MKINVFLWFQLLDEEEYVDEEIENPPKRQKLSSHPNNK